MRAHLRETLTRAPDHYELLDRRLVGWLAGTLFVVGGVLSGVLLAFEPPVHAIGGAGWVVASGLIATAFLAGAGMAATRRVIPPAALVAVGLSGPTMIAILQWLAGARSSYDALLLLSVLWAAVVLPPRPVVGVLAYATAVSLLPLTYGSWDRDLAARHVAALGVVWMLASACLLWSARIREIRRQLRRQRNAADALARVDELTGLGNRRALDEALAAQVAIAARTGRPLSALVGDLDGFKRINDRDGHHAGDALLRAVAATLRDVVRRPDACFRWGGDEFVVLLPEATLEAARDVGRRIADAVRERCATPGGAPVGLSLGAAEHAAGATSVSLLAAADAALLDAKAAAAQRR